MNSDCSRFLDEYIANVLFFAHRNNIKKQQELFYLIKQNEYNNEYFKTMQQLAKKLKKLKKVS